MTRYATRSVRPFLSLFAFSTMGSELFFSILC